MKDFNCFIGSWPFYRLDGDFSGLCRDHAKNGIESGFVSTLESVFYNDFYESEAELARIIKGSGYIHTVVPNPTVQGCEQMLKRCFEEFDVGGVRLVPGYHGYSLDDVRLEPIIDLARRKKVPLFVNVRLTDERMTHMIHPVLASVEEIAAFVDSTTDVNVVLCYLLCHEADAVMRACKNSDKLHFDTSGMAGCMFETDPQDYMSRCVLGTGFPLRAVSSAVMRIKNEMSCEEQKNAILNAKI